MPVEVVVDSVRIDLLARHRLVVLKEAKGERYLPIVIGAAEAGAIAIKLMNAEVPRPLTHDLLFNMILTLGGRVTHILLNDVTGDIFYARTVMDVDGRHVEVDSRPSDAIALAVRANVPIFVEEVVLERAAIELGGRAGAAADAKAEESVDEAQLGAFREIINQLDLDDLGGKP